MRSTIEWDSIRTRLAGTTGREYWRSLEQLAGAEEFQHYLENEFPHPLPEAPTARRRGTSVAPSPSAPSTASSTNGTTIHQLPAKSMR